MSIAALTQVASEYCETIDPMDSQDKDAPVFKDSAEGSRALAQSIVEFHQGVCSVNERLRRKGAGRGTFITPRHYLDFILHFKALYVEKSELVAEQQRHLGEGLRKLKETEDDV